MGNQQERLICGHRFELVSVIHAELGEEARRCRFIVPGSPSGAPASGAYVFTVDDRVMYVGQTGNFDQRMRSYGDKPGTDDPAPGPTDRRINGRIGDALAAGRDVAVWFHPSPAPQSLERELIRSLDLSWNLAGTDHDWRRARRDAEEARHQMATDLGGALRKFSRLLGAFPHDGMVYFERARGYEERQDHMLALADYIRAELLLPFTARKSEAHEGITRTAARLMPRTAR